MLLQGFDKPGFLRDYWQQKPLLIKHSGRRFVDPIDADELAGLACEPEMESRLVSTDAEGCWTLQHGPFNEHSFGHLGESNWTLLVQAVDQLVPGVDALKAAFNFLPSWRIDDVMVSYACDGGGVGAHFDQYDVFLIQGSGSRRWQTGQRCDHSTLLRRNTELSLLEKFNPHADYVLEAGDILYLPPRFAHHGVSLGNSLCYSIGFRAPSLAELAQEFSAHLEDLLVEDQRFEDPRMQNVVAPERIAESAIAHAFDTTHTLFNNRAAFTDAFGSYVTRPRYPERIEAAVTSRLSAELPGLVLAAARTSGLAKNAASRMAYFQSGTTISFYVDGNPWPCVLDQLPLVEELCARPWWQPLQLANLLEPGRDTDLLIALLNQGTLVLEQPGASPYSND